MQIVTKQISILISKEEQDSLFELADKVSDTYICGLIYCDGCTEVCNKDICPFYKLDDELHEVVNKIVKAAEEYGPKEEKGVE